MPRRKANTELIARDVRQKVLELFFAGVAVEKIAEEVQRSKQQVYTIIRQTRLDLIAQKKDHFDERLAILFDDTFDALATNAALLSDKKFLETAAPERIDSVSRAYGILSDKCFVLLSAAGNARRNQSGAGQDPAPVEGAGSGGAIAGS